MKVSKKLSLLLLTVLLTGAALLSVPPPAFSQCWFYCWPVTDGIVCCETFSCEIVCSGG